MSSPFLRELAGRLGIVPEYLDQTGRRAHPTSDATREALLSVMGFDAPSEEAARGWLSELDHEERAAILEPVRVVERDSADARLVRIRPPIGTRAARVELTIAEESGAVSTMRRDIRGPATIRLPPSTRLPHGYHRLTAVVRSPHGGEHLAEQSLIVVPSACLAPGQALGERRKGTRRGAGDARAMGIVANLYSVRREHDWGVGDFTTLARLATWAAERGAQFVGVNPLHALLNRGWNISPYSPVSRLFRNPVYIDVESVPELAHSDAARAILNRPEVRARLRELRVAPLIEYDGIIELKDRVLFELYLVFRGRDTARRREFEDFSRLREPELTRFATWMALAERHGLPDWRRWPASLHDPESDGVRAFRAEHAQRVDYHRWLQFEADAQLAAAARGARAQGMRIGVYQDLAIGTSPGGSDTWSYPDLFLAGAAVGAPPDPYAPRGQNWGLPPMDPRALRRDGYRFWIQLLRRAFEHSGALRIDHVMGLFRAFWIPDGASGRDGAYVRFPANDMLGILALESVRHDALVVGEDLGTVPRDVPPALKKWNILSSRVLYFERDRRGYKPARGYPALALATANTHDLPTLAGFWQERDIDLRSKVGLLRSPAAVRAARRERTAEKRALLAALRLQPPRHYQEAHFPLRLAAAVHEFLCSTPAALVGVSLDDLLGEVEPVNVPGVGADLHPSWRRRMRLTLEALSWNFEADDALRCGSRRPRTR